jgi:hypothetical protein
VPARNTSREQTAFVAALDRLLEPLENLGFEPLENSQEESLQRGSSWPQQLAIENVRLAQRRRRRRIAQWFHLLPARARISQRSPYRQVRQLRAVLWLGGIGLVLIAILWYIEHMA